MYKSQADIPNEKEDSAALSSELSCFDSTRRKICLAASDDLDLEAQIDTVGDDNDIASISTSSSAPEIASESGDEILTSLDNNDTFVTLQEPPSEQSTTQRQSNSDQQGHETIADRSYTVSWQSDAQGDKFCGIIVLPRFTCLFAFMAFLAVLFVCLGLQ